MERESIPEIDSDVYFTLFMARECFVYKPPPIASAAGSRAETWGLDKPIFTGRITVLANSQDECHIKLTDANGEVFVESRFQEDSARFVEPAIDSSRYFVLTVLDGEKKAFLGIGFRDREMAFDFKAALFERDRKRKQTAADPASDSMTAEDVEVWGTEPLSQAAGSHPDTATDVDLRLQQPIRLELKSVGSSTRAHKPASHATSVFSVLLPPPPSTHPTTSDSSPQPLEEQTMDESFGDFQTA